MGYVYKIENTANGKVYIGKTRRSNPQRRWIEHVRDSKNPCRNQRAQYRAMNKYGVDKFTFDVLEETDVPEQREEYYINQYGSYGNGYNETHGGDGKPYLTLPKEEVLQMYESGMYIKQIAKHFHCDPSSISNLLKRNGIQIPTQKEMAIKYFSKRVAQLDLKTGAVLKEFDSVSEASQFQSGYDNSHINSVCQGKRKSAFGYGWKYI